MKPLLSLLAVLPAVALMSCSSSDGDPNYDTTDPYGNGGAQQAAAAPATADGVESGSYQALTPGAAASASASTAAGKPAATASAAADNPVYAPAVYEDNTPAASSAVKRPASATTTSRPKATANHVMADEAPARSSGTTHTVVKGDSLWSIGKKYGVSVTAIKQANNLTKDTVVLGQKVKIPAR